jgi:hypothetical protein
LETRATKESARRSRHPLCWPPASHGTRSCPQPNTSAASSTTRYSRP